MIRKARSLGRPVPAELQRIKVSGRASIPSSADAQEIKLRFCKLPVQP